MNANFLKKLSLYCFLLSLLGLGSCNVQIGGCIPQVKYERVVQLSHPMEQGSTFEAQTHNGSITITGTSTVDCNLTVTITSRAATEEQAKALAEQTTIKLERFNNKLTTKVKKPKLTHNQSICFSYKAITPNQTNLELTTHNGHVQITNLTGSLKAETHNGAVKASNVSGCIQFTTHNGSVTCKNLNGNAKLCTHNGRINLTCSPDTPSACNVISAITHNGGIDFTAPPDYSAKVEASKHNGKIKTSLPITVVGELSKRKITGTIGTGQNTLHLETHNGSINIK